MDIPDMFTPEFFEKEILKTNLKIENFFSGRVRLSIFRSGGGLYSPESSLPVYVIQSKKFDEKTFKINDKPFRVDLFKEYLTLQHRNIYLKIDKEYNYHQGQYQNNFINLID